MSLEYGDEEMDRLLAAADEHLLNIDVVDESQPPTSPELLGAVVRTPTIDAESGGAGMAPPEGSARVLREEEGHCQGPSPVDSTHAHYIVSPSPCFPVFAVSTHVHCKLSTHSPSTQKSLSTHPITSL